MPLLRSQQRNIYHFCDRCGVRWPLSQLTWQNGILVCRGNACRDTAVVGSRDMNVARQVSVNRNELQPDPKLTNPTSRQNDELEPLY